MRRQSKQREMRAATRHHCISLITTCCFLAKFGQGYGQAGVSDRQISRFRQASKVQRLKSDAWILQNGGAGTSFVSNGGPNCPCSDPKLCHPISSKSVPIRTKGEVYGFADKSTTGESYNWTHISTVAWADSDILMCQAHKNGARAVLAAPSFNLSYMATLAPNSIIRQQYIENWVERAISMVTTRHRDGIVFDFEGPLQSGSPEGEAYVDLINATRNTFHHSIPSHPLQVTTCVAWSPDGIDGRKFPYQELAQVSDLLYVMDYDTQSQIIQGPCIANANAPYSGMKQGIERYLSLGISRRQLILGVPWYGYKYSCLKGTQAHDRFCPIQEVPFRGINCSDAAGREVPYSVLLSEFHNQTSVERQSTGGLRRDTYMDASFFNIIGDDHVVYQSWMDDPISLRHKFSYAKVMGMGGIGPFTFDDLNPSSQPQESRLMWSAFDAFLDGSFTS